MMNYAEDSFCQKAIECLNKVEKLGNPACKAMLAMIYSDGISASKDEERFFRLYTELFNTTDEMKYIHNNLGVILKNGNQSVSKNIPLAIEYFEAAIKKFYDIFALFNLFRMYLYGEEVPKNIDKAITLLSQLKTSQFDSSRILDYIQRHSMISTHIFNETSDHCDMNQILPISYRDLFPPKCFNSIAFVYSIGSWNLMRISPNALIQKQLKSEMSLIPFMKRYYKYLYFFMIFR